MSAVAVIKECVGGFWSLLVGMRITIGQLFKPTVTVHYPYESLKMAPRYRGHIELLRDPATGKARCTACKACERACPSFCIAVDGARPEGEKFKRVTTFTLNFTTCSLCGSCVEACKFDALDFSKVYNQAGTRREEYQTMDLVKLLEEKPK